MSRILLDRVGKVFQAGSGKPIHAIRQLTLAVEDGEHLVVAGPSGCGKSTLLRLIAGLDMPDEGDIFFDGRPARDLRPQDRNLGMVFQQDALLPHMTIAENLGFGLRLQGTPAAETRRRVCETAALLEITDCLDRMPEQLSGGQRQRTALGRAIIRKPKILLLDEPLSSLDTPLRAQLRSELQRIHRQLHCTIVHVTHDQSDALAMGHRIAILREGSLIQAADAQTIYSRPLNTFVAGFIGYPPMNFFRVVPSSGNSGHSIRCLAADGQARFYRISEVACPPTAAGEPGSLLLGVRSEDIGFKPFANCQDPPFAQATIERVEPLGATRIVHGVLAGLPFAANIDIGDAVVPDAVVPIFLNLPRICWFEAATGQAI